MVSLEAWIIKRDGFKYSELKVMYDHRPSKIDLHKQFEARTWQSGETIHDYYHEKNF